LDDLETAFFVSPQSSVCDLRIMIEESEPIVTRDVGRQFRFLPP